MPTTRRKSAGPATRGGQSRLSFGARAKVTKPSTSTSAKAKQFDNVKTAPATRSEDATPEAETAAEEVELEPEAEPEMIKPAATPISAPIEAEQQARKLTDARIKAYWRAREAERKTPRVHQQDLTLHEKILRHFDLSSQYGPCIGITRLNRWKRASALQLHPPLEVLGVLLTEEGTAQRAHMDELLGGRFTAAEQASYTVAS